MKRGRSHRAVELIALWCLCVDTLAGCASSAIEPAQFVTGPDSETLYVLASGWHTEIGLRSDALTGPLAVLRGESPAASYVVFGWGQRDYYMTPHPGIGDLLSAVFPGPAVLLAIWLDRSPADAFIGSQVLVVHASHEGLDRLSAYLWEQLEKENGVPHRIGDGPYPNSAFYASTGTYDLANTCNTWTAEALHLAGLPVSAAGVIFAGQVVDQVRQINASDRRQAQPGDESDGRGRDRNAFLSQAWRARLTRAAGPA
jgi:hypothetical protein